MTTTPPTGLSGDYSGSCAVCMTGTDTALAFGGEVQWLIAGLFVLGVPDDRAASMVEQHFGSPLSTVPSGWLSMGVQVCADCVERCPADFPEPVPVSSGQVPVINQP